MPSESKKTIDPDNGGGTDYLSLDAWEDDLGGTSGNLPALDIIAVAECRASSGGNDTAKVIIGGWTTDSTRYIEVRLHPDEQNTGIWNTNNYTHAITETGPFSEVGIYIQENYVRFYDIQFESIKSGGDSFYHFAWNFITSSNLSIINDCIFKGVCSGTGSCHAIHIDDGDARVKMQNDIFYDYVSGTDGGFSGIYVDANDYVDIYQATVKNCRYGIVEISNSITVKNSIVFECFDDFFGVTTVDRCASDDGDGTNPIDITAGGQDWDDQFTDKDNDDYSIKDFDANIWHSSDLTNADDSDVPLFDIAGTPRPPFFGQDTSVGAFELEFVNPSVMLRRRRYMLEHF